MKWQDVRESFPDEWLLLEAVESRSEGGKWIIENLSVVERCGDDSTAVLQCYERYRKSHPQRDFIPLHTSREQLDITELHPIFFTPMDKWQSSE